MTLQQLLQQAIHHGIDALDAQRLMLHVLQKPAFDRAWLVSHDRDAIDPVTQAKYLALVNRRFNHEPLAYITGIKTFYGLQLRIDPRALDPRSDTETLVDWALAACDGLQLNSPCVIDVGTGSGAIALALKHQRPPWQVHATDYSSDALALARSNALQLQLDIGFHHGSWLSHLHDTFHAIVSNPPYIRTDDSHLSALTHEPQLALTSGRDGLDAIRALISQAPARLHPGGWLLLEHGYDQAQAVRTLLSEAGFTEIATRCDLAGLERCSGGRKISMPKAALKP